MRPLHRAIKSLLMLLLGISTFAVLALAGIIFTQTGSHWAIAQITRHTDMIRVGQFSGVLADHIEIHNFQWTGTPQVTVQHAVLDWDFNQLWTGTLFIKQIKVNQVHVSLAQTPQESQPSKPIVIPDAIALPINIAVGDIDLTDITITTADQQQTINHLQLQGSMNEAQIKLDKLHFDGLGLQSTLTATAATQFPYALNANATWKAQLPALPQAAGELHIAGDLRSLVLSLSIASPYHLSGEVLLEPDKGLTQADLTPAVLNLKDIALKGELSVQALHSVDFNTALEPFDLSATIHFNGTPENIRATLTGHVDPANYPALDLEANVAVQGKSIDLEKVLITTPNQSARLAMSGSIALAEPAPEINMLISWEDLRWPLTDQAVALSSKKGQIHITGSGNDLLAELETSLNDTGAIQGVIKKQSAQIEATLNWQELSYPQHQAIVQSRQGKLSFTGTQNQFTTQIQANLSAPNLPSGQISLQGEATEKIFNLKNLTVDALGARVDAFGQIDYRQDIQTKLSLEIQHLDPGLFLKDFPGRINANIETELFFGKASYAAQVTALRAQGSLRDHPLRIFTKGKVRMIKGNRVAMLNAFKEKKAALTLSAFDLTLGNAKVNLTGSITDTLQSTWLIDIPDLGHLLPQAHGQLLTKGQASGSLLQPSLSVSTSGSNIKWKQLEVASIKAEGEINIDQQAPASFNTTLKGISFKNIKAEQFNLSLNGFLDKHQLQLSLDSEFSGHQLDTALEIEGSLKDEQWHFSLNHGQVTLPGMPPWHLSAPGSGQLSKNQQTLERQCWLSGVAKLCLQAQHHASHIQSHISIKELPVSDFSYWLPQGLAIDSSIDGDISVDHEFQNALPDIDANIQLSSGKIEFEALTAIEPEIESIPLLPSNLQLNIKDQALNFNARASFSPADYLTASLSIAPAPEKLAKRRLTGEAQFVMADMRLLDHLLDPIDQLKGTITATTYLSGEVGKPAFSGVLSFDKGSLEVVDAAVKLSEVALKLEFTPQAGATLLAKASSGTGNLILEGASDTDFTKLSDYTQANFNARLIGKKFRILDKRHQKVDIEPDLSINMKDQALYINGTVRIPFADISNIDASPPSAVSVSEDQVIIDDNNDAQAKNADKQTPSMPIHATVRLEMGENIHLEEFGLNANFGGSIVIKEQPGQATSAAGEFRIEKGRFRKLGQDLVVRKGRVIFAGPVTKPGLDIEAVRVINADLVAGIRARGPISQLEQFTLFSDPGGLTQAEILSYITTGRSLAGGSEGEISVLTQASMALAMTGGRYLTDNFGSKLGVDDIGIDTAPGQDSSQAALTIGKYLSPKLYVSSGVGLFSPITTLKLRYSINDKWHFVSESSGAKSSGDFVYQIESGQ